ncbi:MAG: TetR/AcrR family transcriptional regulator [Pseudomonadota bacterium]
MHDRFRQQALDSSKRTRTRAALLDSAVNLVAEAGINRVTLQAITQSCGLAHGTFYNHFDDCEDLIVAAAVGVIDDIHRGMSPALRRSAPGLHRLVGAIELIVSESQRDPARSALLAETIGRFEAVTRRVRPKLRQDVIAGRKAGLVQVRSTRLLDAQIGALVGLAITRQIAKPNAAITRDTSEAVLRLLGVDTDDAHRIVGESLAGSASRSSS